MRRILVITNNLSQASFRLRVGVLVEPLKQRGIELVIQVRPRNWLARKRLLATAGQYDAVLLQRKLLDPTDARLLRRHARQIFYDIDDAVMLEQKPLGPWKRWRLKRQLEATRDIAGVVVAGNEYLAEMFRTGKRKVVILPTMLDVLRYRVKTHQATPSPSLVWIGSRSTLPYVEQFLPAFRLAAQRVPGLRLKIIADATLTDPQLSIDHIPWTEATEVDGLLQGDIGIAPTPDNPWTRGKCGFKIVQYMACGLPVVASPVGVNAMQVRPGETGFLATTDEAWAEAIDTLCQNVPLRARCGARGRRSAEENYSLEQAVAVWSDLFRDPYHNL